MISSWLGAISVPFQHQIILHRGKVFFSRAELNQTVFRWRSGSLWKTSREGDGLLQYERWKGSSECLSLRYLGRLSQIFLENMSFPYFQDWRTRPGVLTSPWEGPQILTPRVVQILLQATIGEETVVIALEKAQVARSSSPRGPLIIMTLSHF